MNVIPKRVDDKRASASLNNSARESQKIVPVRFDSAPTRVRFDSAPTKLRYDSNAPAKSDQESSREKADEEEEEEDVLDAPELPSSTTTTTKVPEANQNEQPSEAKSVVSETLAESDACKDDVEADELEPVAEEDGKVETSEPDEDETPTELAPSPGTSVEPSNVEAEEPTEKRDGSPPLESSSSSSTVAVEKGEELKADEVDCKTPLAENHPDKDESQDEREEKISNPSSPESITPNDVEMEDASKEEEEEKSELPVLEKVDDADKEEPEDDKKSVSEEASDEPPEIAKGESDAKKKEPDKGDDETKAAENETKTVEGEAEEEVKAVEDETMKDDETGDDEIKMGEGETRIPITEVIALDEEDVKSPAEAEPMEVDGKRGKETADAQGGEKNPEMSFCAISDVRTVSDPEDNTPVEDAAKTSKEAVTAVAKKDEPKAVGESKPKSDKQPSKENAERDKDKAEDGKKESSTENSEAEIKSYATDTMNELLGLFGYDKMDDSTKDSLQLKSSISSSTKDKGKDPEIVVNENEAQPASTDGKPNNAAKHKTKDIVERLCAQCDKVKGCKYQVLVHGGRQYLCDDSCFKSFRAKQKVSSASTTVASEHRPQTRSLTTPKDYCSVCRREIKNGLGFLPSSGENKPVCSEECMRKYQSLHAPKRACAQCGSAILGRNKCLTWETMEFCNEDCLGKYQSYLGSHCACCNNAVQRTSLGKYCVRFGSDIKQFCSNNCLEEFKKGLKVCSFCQKDISSGTEGFLAPVGDKGQFKDFCSQRCMEKYETMNSISKVQPTVHQCSVCNKTTTIKVQVSFEGKSHKLCSEPCIAAFRYANKIDTTICDTCEEFFNVDDSERHSIQFEGMSKRFCTKTCMNVFVLSHRKIVPCTWCKVKKYNFDMIERVDSNNHVQLFCSLNCLSLFRVSLNATSSRSIRCDFCQHSRPAQYHLTMSDASIRNFCSYQCVMNFQGQFTNVAPVTPSSPVQPPVTATNSQTNNGTPVISSVMSLAPAQPAKAPAATKQVKSSTSISSSAAVAAAAAAAAAATVVTTATTTTTTTSSSSASTPQMTQQIIIKPPPPKLVKNKSILCKPFLQTKGVSCKPHPCHKGTQKDDDKEEKEEEEKPGRPVLFPIPVPIYVPVPMHMYVNPTPVPLTFPIPIPVPIFIPTTKNTAEGIMQHIKEIKNKIPENPFEAELLMMAEMVAVNNGSKKNKAQSEENEENNSPSDHHSIDEEHSRQDSVDTQLQDQVNTTNAFSDDMLQMALRMATEMDEPAMDLEDVLASGKSQQQQQQQQQQESDYNNVEDGDVLSPRELRARTRSQKRVGGSGRGRGRKRARIERSSSPQPAPGTVGIPENVGVLKFTYGVNAWKHWVLQKNTQLEKASQSNRKLKLFKTDLLQLTADELNYSLCLFVKEVRKPNGEEYAPDSIFYLCLGIQQYLFDNGRIDNIFTDAYYEKFTECLNEVLQRYDSIVTADTFMLSRIEEEILWESKQLGAHSPHVLLNTLMYFNTKYFILKTVEDHMKLSFLHVMKHWRKPVGAGGRAANTNNANRNVLLRYCPPPSQKGLEVGRKRKEEQPVYEQLENVENPLRCPVKLYEFYLSKCPESIKNRSDVFYLYPERSCVPDSPVWYSTMPLGREAVSKMLQRIKMVREVCDTFATPTTTPTTPAPAQT